MNISRECKRLAEVDFPIAAVSAHSAREKSIRHGHPSTLHLWWARRPLAACRAMLMGLRRAAPKLVSSGYTESNALGGVRYWCQPRKVGQSCI